LEENLIKANAHCKAVVDSSGFFVAQLNALKIFPFCLTMTPSPKGANIGY